MIQVIGIKRIIVLLVLLAVNVALAAAVYLYTVPENIKLERKLRSLNSQVSSVSSDLDRIKVEFEQLDAQQDRFYELKDEGFFTTQVRSDAKKLFSLIQNQSDVISAVVSVKSGVIMNSVEAQKANHKVLRSSIDVEVRSFDDMAIYKYINIAKLKFPGHLSLKSIVMNRTRDVNSATIRAIAAGASPELVNAKIKFSWYTLIPESQVIVAGDSK